MRQTGTAIFMYRLDSGEIIEANDIAVSHYGFSHSTLQQMTIDDLMAGLSDVEEGSAHPSVMHRRCDGQSIQVEILKGVYYWGDKSCGFIVCRNRG